MSEFKLTFKCPSCGSVEGFEQDTYVKCKHCGNKYRKDLRDDPIYADLSYAVNERQEADFDKARRRYDALIAKHRSGAGLEEAYWGRFLCEQYVIFYQNDVGDSIPSFWNINDQPCQKSESYKKALQYGEASGNRANYERLAEQIEEYKEKYRKVKEENPEGSQIFICFKDSGTTDSNLGYEIYNQFAGKYRIFFSRKSLDSIRGNDYEPYIYHALTTASVLLILCSSRENLESKWVHNEWWRFWRFSKGTDKTIIPICRKNFDPSQLPDEIRNCQAHKEDIHLISVLSTHLDAILKNDESSTAPLTSFSKKLNLVNATFDAGNVDDAKIQLNELMKECVGRPYDHISALLLQAKILSSNYKYLNNANAKSSIANAEELAKSNDVQIRDMPEYKHYRAAKSKKGTKKVLLTLLILLMVAGASLGVFFAVRDPMVDLYVTGKPSTIEIEYGSNYLNAIPSITTVSQKGKETTVEVNSSMVSGFDPTKVGLQTVEITYNGMTIQVSINVTKYSLAAPSSLTLTDGKLTWASVPLAQSYTLQIDNTVIENITTTTYESDLFATVGLHSVRVKANADSTVGMDSAYCAPISVASFKEASNLRLESGKLVWDAVAGCTQYDLYRDGQKVASSMTNSFVADAAYFNAGANQFYVLPVNACNVKLAGDMSEGEFDNYEHNSELMLYKLNQATGLQYDNATGKLAWDALAGDGVQYTVYLNGAVMATVSEASCAPDWSRLLAGENEVYVLPTGGVYLTERSDVSDYENNGTVTLRKLTQATGLSFDVSTGVLAWDALATAGVQYKIYLNGSVLTTVSEATCTVDLSRLLVGDNKFYVLPTAGCYLTDRSDLNDYETNGEISVKKLATVTGLSVSGNTMSWSAVEGATGYEIFVNGSFLLRTAETSCSVSLGADQLSAVYTVRAVGGADVISADISSEKISFTKLAAPTGVSVNAGGVLSWNAVSGANGYDIYVNGSLHETVDASTLTLNLLGEFERGEYQISVFAKGNGGTLLSSEQSEIFVYSVTETLVYITDEADLKNMVLDLGAAYVLKNNITLTGTWTPIGTTATPFTGRFDGKGYTISGLTLSATSSQGTGLFGVIGASATVKDFTLENVSANGASSGRIGAVAGINYGSISGVTVYGAIESAGGDYAGGIAGNNLGSIYDCVNHATVTGKKYAGGIAGNCKVTGYDVQLHSCQNLGTVSGTLYVGGIAGYLEIEKKITVYGMSNEANVTSSGQYAGGIFGYTDGSAQGGGTMNSCTNSGNVTATNYAGGCFGYQGGYITVTTNNISDPSLNCTNSGEVTATTGTKFDEIAAK